MRRNGYTKEAARAWIYVLKEQLI